MGQGYVGLKCYVAKQQSEALNTVGLTTQLSHSLSLLYPVESWMGFVVGTG